MTYLVSRPHRAGRPVDFSISVVWRDDVEMWAVSGTSPIFQVLSRNYLCHYLKRAMICKNTLKGGFCFLKVVLISVHKKSDLANCSIFPDRLLLITVVPPTFRLSADVDRAGLTCLSSPHLFPCK